MGHSGLVVMSESDALAIRGMGYRGHNSYRAKKEVRTSSEAEGRSWANVELDGYKEEADAGSFNKYEAEGQYFASGENFSEATLSKTESTVTDYPDGTTGSVTKTYTIHVEAGGFSSAKSL
jgi:hypothetical protein